MAEFTSHKSVVFPVLMNKLWKRLHNERLHSLYSSASIQVSNSRIMRWAGHVARMGERRVEYWVLLDKSEGKWPLGRPRCR